MKIQCECGRVIDLEKRQPPSKMTAQLYDELKTAFRSKWPPRRKRYSNGI